VDGSRIRKEKVADSKISGYVWTGPKVVFYLDQPFQLQPVWGDTVTLLSTFPAVFG